jgi:hypothetical protein
VQLLGDQRRRAGLDDASRRALQWFVLPVWAGAGLADWWCHRRADIEHTAGTRESAIHALMMAESGVPTLLGLFCEINTAVLAATYATLALHEATAIWDVAYADGRREVTPTEQHVHGFLERVPTMATAFMTVLHWDQARAALGLEGRRDWKLRPKRRPLSRRYRAGLLGAVAATLAAPYAEELARCLRAGPTPPASPVWPLVKNASSPAAAGDSSRSARRWW